MKFMKNDSLLTGQSVVDAKNLVKKFGDFIAVNGISFRITAGECFGILGPNGAGKTSTIRMVYGFSPMTRGSLEVFGLDIQRDWRKIKQKIGICQQENSLDPDLTVVENLEVFAEYFDIPRHSAVKKARELLSFISLDHRMNSPVIELSGGLMRRLILARALINDPDLLILDEPTTGLDPQSRHQIWERLDTLKETGMSVLLTTHYMEEASRLCDRLIIIDHGQILVQGKPSDLIHNHVGRDVIEINSPAPKLRSFLESAQIAFDDLGYRIIIYFDEKDELYHRIIKEYCQQGCIIRIATLEDVFLKLTGRELRE